MIYRKIQSLLSSELRWRQIGNSFSSFPFLINIIWKLWFLFEGQEIRVSSSHPVRPTSNLEARVYVISEILFFCILPASCFQFTLSFLLSVVFVEWLPAAIWKFPHVQLLFYFYSAFSQPNFLYIQSGHGKNTDQRNVTIIPYFFPVFHTILKTTIYMYIYIVYIYVYYQI